VYIQSPQVRNDIRLICRRLEWPQVNQSTQVWRQCIDYLSVGVPSRRIGTAVWCWHYCEFN